jgi:transcriptional regulator with XRE-family HTH domain
MPVRPSPTVRRRRLRYELRRLREQHGLTIEQVQEQSGGDLRAPTISRWETGDRSIRPTDLRLLLDIYDIHGEQREGLLTLARQAKERGWWQSYGSAVPEWFQVYVGLEAEAGSVHVYEPELVPGLLQTAEYYRTFLWADPAAAHDDEVQRKIAVRAARQERLSGDDPPGYRAVLNEAVIRRVVGGAEVMREQLTHILEVAELPHVSIQVLPFSAGVHPAMDGAFRILGFPGPGDPDVVYLENQINSLYLEEAPEVARYAQMFSHLVTKALDPDDSRRMITQAAKDLTGLPAYGRCGMAAIGDMDLSRTAWRKSAYSNNGGDCVEVARTGPAVAVRDSKNPRGPFLAFTPGQWHAFTARLAAGALNLT